MNRAKREEVVVDLLRPFLEFMLRAASIIWKSIKEAAPPLSKALPGATCNGGMGVLAQKYEKESMVHSQEQGSGQRPWEESQPYKRACSSLLSFSIPGYHMSAHSRPLNNIRTTVNASL